MAEDIPLILVGGFKGKTFYNERTVGRGCTIQYGHLRTLVRHRLGVARNCAEAIGKRAVGECCRVGVRHDAPGEGM